MVRRVGHLFLLAAEAEGLLEVVALRTDFRERRASPLGFAVGEAGKSERAVETKALRQLGVEVEFAAVPQPRTQKRGRRPRCLKLAAAGQALRARIGRVDRPVALRQRGRLGVDIPVAGLRQFGLAVDRRHPRRIAEMIVQAELEQVNARLDVDVRRSQSR